MVQPGAVQAAVEHKVPEALRKAQLHRQHGVGIVLFHRVDLRSLGDIAQGVKVADDGIGGQAQPFQVPQNYITLSEAGDVKSMNKRIDMLEDSDDVQNVWHNWDND